MRSTKANLLTISGAIAGCIVATPNTTFAQKPDTERPTAAPPAHKAPAQSPAATMVVRQRDLVYNAGESVVSGGLALGGINGAAGESDAPPVFAAFDLGVGPEISIGAVASYYKSSTNYGYAGLARYTTSYTYKTLGFRADYHFGRYLPLEKLDVYGGLLLAYGMVSVSAETSSPLAGAVTGSSASSNLVVWGANLGARYFFSKALAAQMEAGVGLGNLSLGIAYKF